MTTAGTIEALTVAPETVQDDLTLSIKREPRPKGDLVAEHEGRWVGHLRRIGAARLRHWAFSDDLVGDAEVAISELVTNALLHGTGDQVDFRLLLTADFLALEVNDGSPGRAHVNAADLYDENGRGLLLVSELSTRWGVSPDGRVTWCTFRLRGREA